MGYDALMMTEHHFHPEGFDFSVNPLMVLTDLAARTERILPAPLGLALPAGDPVRAAEDVALLDQFSKGRLRLGVARGHQNRWMKRPGPAVAILRSRGLPSHSGSLSRARVSTVCP